VKTLVNTTVVSTVAAVGQLNLLQQLHGRLYLPNEVYEEILNGLEERYGFYTGIEDQIFPFAEGGWMELVSMVTEEELRLFQSLPRRLHHGKAACLAFARQRNWALLTDDKLARRMAQDLGIVVSGTLGVLVQAAKRKIFTAEEGDTLLRAMIARG
jgi:predicted nucleic acid-binding protein